MTGERSIQRRPRWWHDVEVREAAISTYRQMPVVMAIDTITARFGSERAPSKSSLHRFWMALDKAEIDLSGGLSVNEQAQRVGRACRAMRERQGEMGVFEAVTGIKPSSPASVTPELGVFAALMNAREPFEKKIEFPRSPFKARLLGIVAKILCQAGRFFHDKAMRAAVRDHE